MALFNKLKRRRVFNGIIPSLAAATVAIPDANAALRPKAPGETKVVAIFGTEYWHNGVAHEICIRSIFESKKDWRIIFVRANKFFTPELISDADLLITCRTSSADPIDFFTEGQDLAETMQKGSRLWTDENVEAIIDNVRNRGMGFLALHNTIYSESREILDFIDVKEIMHHEIQPIWVRRLNQNHPITQGVGKFYIVLDEQFAVIIKSKYTTTLFETTAIHEKRQAIGGWCLENGKGRVVGLLPGHTVFPYRAPEYQNIIWRAAYWAMKRDIPRYPNENNTLY